MRKLLSPACLFVVTVVAIVSFIAPFASAQETKQSDREAMYRRYLDFASHIKGGSVQPHWMADGSSFWYAEGVPANTVIWKVDPEAHTKTPLFDAVRLRRALAEVLGHTPPNQGLPFNEFTFLEGEKAVRFTVEEKEFVLQLETYAISPGRVITAEEKDRHLAQVVWVDVAGHPMARELRSPDGRWFAGIQNHNVSLRSPADGSRVAITTDGILDWAYDIEEAKWSPDSSRLVIKKLDYRAAPKLPIVHWLGAQEQVEWTPERSIFSRTKAGMPLPQTELFVLDVRSKRAVRIAAGDEKDQHIYPMEWKEDGSELYFVRLNRLFKRLDLIAAKPENGSCRVVLTESQPTFLEGILLVWELPRMLAQLDRGQRFVWRSERDGFNHLFLYDTNGKLLRRLTEGNFPVKEIVTVDDKARWVYFTAHGKPDRPYDTQLYRVSLKGNHLTLLSEGTGEHAIQIAPSKNFFLDTHSNVDRLPVVELRHSGGKLLQTLARTNSNVLQELKFKSPEEFTVKAADGRTDLHGVLYKPYDFDPARKYPVIEFIYGCPTEAIVQRAFSPGVALPGSPSQALAVAQLGFITFMVDGRGTPERGKRFQDVAYGNIGRHEIPDHLATLKQLAAQRPFMDLNRVGIAGHSCGGYFTIRAMLLEPHIYRVGVASAPMTDLYFGNAMELYMGLPDENREAYEFASNLRLADQLKGKLLLIHGTSDFSVPFSATVKMIDALIRAKKPYDLVIVPEQDHVPSAGTPRAYWLEAMKRYFQEHLKP